MEIIFVTLIKQGGGIVAKSGSGIKSSANIGLCNSAFANVCCVTPTTGTGFAMRFESASIMYTPALQSFDRFGDIADYFRQHTDVTLCAIVDAGMRPIGCVSAAEFKNLLASPFGFSLHQKKLADALMQPGVIVVSMREKVSEALGQLHDNEAILRDGLVVVDNAGRYVGTMSGLCVFRTMNALHADMLASLKREVAERKEAEGKIKRLADSDPLTDILNRRAFVREVNQHILDRLPFACAFIDLDRFKQLNDRYGHAVGDEVLRVVARRLTRHPEISDAARLGGDEFAFVIRQASDASTLADFIESVHADLTDGIDTSVGRVFVGASIGYSVHLVDTNESSAMLHAADKAMLRVKSQGGGVSRFDPALDATGEDGHAIELALSAAIATGRLQPAFQPIWDVRASRIVGYEMLARWPDSGLSSDPSPGQFIPIAERLGLIDPLFWTLADKAISSLGKDDHFLAMNISPSQLTSDHFATRLEKLLNRYGVDPARIELEVTEHVFFGNLERSLAVLKPVRQLGVSLALDDFGTGYSSLSLIDQLPFSKIKIDQSFVRGRGQSFVRGKVLQATIALCREVGITSCTEGIETADDLALVADLGCDQAQGYFIGRPSWLRDGGQIPSRALSA